MGRGEYYRNKYGNGGRGGGRGRGDDAGGEREYSTRGQSPSGPRYDGGRGRGRGGWRGGHSSASAPPAAPPNTALTVALSWEQLGGILQDIHNRNYNAYHDLERVFVYSSSNLKFRLAFDHIQGDPYASPSRAHVQVEAAAAAFPVEMYNKKIRNIALCDYLTRTFAASAKSASADAKTGTIQRTARSFYAQYTLMLNCGMHIDSERLVPWRKRWRYYDRRAGPARDRAVVRDGPGERHY